MGFPSPRVRALDALLVVGLAVAGHTAALRASDGFTVDDHEIVQHEPRLSIDSPDDVWTLVSTSYWGETYRAERLWRPVVLLTFAADRALWGPDPRGYHAVSIALHAATSVLALALFARLLPRRAALAGALVFAVHPVHAEATAGLVGRAEVLALLCALAGLLLHLRAREAPPAPAWRDALRWLAPCACFLVGFGSKEVALTAPFVAPLLERAACAPQTTRARRLAPYALYLAAIVGYFVVRAQVLGGLFPPPEAQSIGVLPLHVRLLVAAGTASDALSSILRPTLTAALFPFTPPRWSDPVALLRVAAHLALLGLAVAALAGRSRLRRAFGLGTLGFYMTLGPSANIIPIGVVFAERLVYTPSAWALLALAALAARALRGRRAAMTVVLAVALCGCALRLAHSVHAWTDDLALWTSNLTRFPDDPRVHQEYGAQLLHRDPERAISHLTYAVEGSPPPARNAASARALLGAALHRVGRSREALAVLAEARAIDPSNRNALEQLVTIQRDAGLAARVPAERERLLRLSERTGREGTRAVPHSYQLWLQWGTTLTYLEGREADAEQAFTSALARRPDGWEARWNRALLRKARHDLPGQLEDYRGIVAALGAKATRSPEERQFLGMATLGRALVAARLGLAEEAAAARAWLARERPELVERLDEALRE